MTLEKLMEKSTIAFPKPLELDQTEEMLEFVVNSLPVNISYKASYYNNFLKDDNKKTIKDRGTSSIGGHIHKRNDAVIDFFQTVHYNQGTHKISAIRFNLIPGYDISDYDPKTLKLWDDVREVIGKYFDSK